jgi:hypothetical protein
MQTVAKTGCYDTITNACQNTPDLNSSNYQNYICYATGQSQGQSTKDFCEQSAGIPADTQLCIDCNGNNCSST